MIRLLKIFLIKIVDLYQKYLSPLRPATCRFTPTCSSYAKEVLISRNLPTAILLTIVRILKCNPWSQGGYDPIPQLYKPQHTKAVLARGLLEELK